MKIINDFKKGLIQGIGIITIIAIAGITYASFDFNAQINQAGTNTTLSSTEYNKLVQKLNEIKKEQLATARVNFEGQTNPVVMNQKFNISHITKDSSSAGYYNIYFETPMENALYSVSWSANTYNDDTWGNYFPTMQVQAKHKEYVRIKAGYMIYEGANKTFYSNIHLPNISIQVFGGK